LACRVRALPQFLRPAANDDFRIEANVLRFGKASAFAEARLARAAGGQLVAHASSEFASDAVAAHAACSCPPSN